MDRILNFNHTDVVKKIMIQQVAATRFMILQIYNDLQKKKAQILLFVKKSRRLKEKPKFTNYNIKMDQP